MKRNIHFSKLISLLLLATLILSVPACSDNHAVEQPYLDSVKNADVFIDLPTLRQYGGYTCGTTCVQMIMNWLNPYEGDLNPATYEELLSTTDETGTPPANILCFFDNNSVTYHVQEHMTIQSLTSALDAGHPLLMPIQAWSTAEDGTFNTQNSDNPETYLIEGHWVICVGYQKTGSTYRFYFNDPASVGYCFLDQNELEERWIDMAYDGEIFDRYAIEITSTPGYLPDGAFHMD